jgi:hypothetical protein
MIHLFEVIAAIWLMASIAAVVVFCLIARNHPGR